MRMINAKYVVVLVALASASCASSSGGITPSTAKPPAVGAAAVTPAAEARTRVTRIVVEGASGDCTATIDDEVLVGKPNKKIGWLVEDASGGCSTGEDWHVELVFTSEWNHGRDRTVKVNRDDFKVIRIHPQTPPTPPGAGNGHKYKVYLVYPRFWTADIRIPVIDPEVDIEM